MPAVLGFLFDATTQRVVWTCSIKSKPFWRLLPIFSPLLPSLKHSCLFHLQITVIKFFHTVPYSWIIILHHIQQQINIYLCGNIWLSIKMKTLGNQWLGKKVPCLCGQGILAPLVCKWLELWLIKHNPRSYFEAFQGTMIVFLQHVVYILTYGTVTLI